MWMDVASAVPAHWGQPTQELAAFSCTGTSVLAHGAELMVTLHECSDSCVLSAFRTLLNEGLATMPCLAKRLTSELILHINVSSRVIWRVLQFPPNCGTEGPGAGGPCKLQTQLNTLRNSQASCPELPVYTW